MGMLCEHYSDKWSVRIRPITPTMSGFWKPDGCLWLSPVESAWPWSMWCKENEYRLGKYRYTAYIATDSMYVYDHPSKWNELPRFDLDMVGTYVDFVELAKMGYQSFHLTADMAAYARYTFSEDARAFSSWDCETVMVMDERCILSWQRADRVQDGRNGALQSASERNSINA